MKISSFTWNTQGTKELPAFEASADMVTISLQECYKPPDVGTLRKTFGYCVSESMFGLQTIILSKHRIETEPIRLGLGPWGFVNKGFIAMRINKSILHVNVHLSAHDYNHEKRLKQLRAVLGFCGAMKPGMEQWTDTIILTGDLNFRMKDGVDQSADFLRLFPQFKESTIEFRPTYKYKNDVLVLSRAPSYCDRVFVASKYSPVFLKYTSMSQVTASDHKPVTCEFIISGAKRESKIFAASEHSIESGAPNFGTRSIFQLLTNTYIFCIENITALSAAILFLAFSVTVRLLLSTN